MGMDSAIRAVVTEAIQRAALGTDRQSKPSMAEASDQLWNAIDVARFLKASRSWVYQKAEAGLLPCLHVGGLLRFDPVQIRAWARGEGGATVTPMLGRRR
jgi:hypothetical protein